MTFTLTIAQKSHDEESNKRNSTRFTYSSARDPTITKIEGNFNPPPAIWQAINARRCGGSGNGDTTETEGMILQMHVHREYELTLSIIERQCKCAKSDISSSYIQIDTESTAHSLGGDTT